MIMGDFNLHIQEEKTVITEFKNSLFAMGLVQHVDFGTHVAGNTLDLVITEAANGVDVLSCTPGTYFSDHCSVKIVTNIKKETITCKRVSYRNLKDMNKSEFAKDLRNIAIDAENVDNYVDQFEDEVKRIMDIDAPMQEKMKICRAPKPWFTENIAILKRKFRKAESLWRKYKHPHLYEQFKEARNNYTNEINREKCNTLSQKIISSKGDSKMLYKFVSELTGKSIENKMPNDIQENNLAEAFADHFMNKIDIISRIFERF